jgi:hypothetical protein
MVDSKQFGKGNGKPNGKGRSFQTDFETYGELAREINNDALYDDMYRMQLSMGINNDFDMYFSIANDSLINAEENFRDHATNHACIRNAEDYVELVGLMLKVAQKYDVSQKNRNEMIDRVRKLKRRVYFAKEFPGCASQMSVADEDFRKAIADENYPLAKIQGAKRDEVFYRNCSYIPVRDIDEETAREEARIVYQGVIAQFNKSLIEIDMNFNWLGSGAISDARKDAIRSGIPQKVEALEGIFLDMQVLEFSEQECAPYQEMLGRLKKRLNPDRRK